MTSPEPDASIPPAAQGTGLGTVKYEDLIGSDVKLEFSGTTAKVKGTIKKIDTPWVEFDKTNNTGHFFPVILPSKCADKDVTFKGKAQDATIHITDDRILIIRLENLSGNTASVVLEGETVLTLDFSTATKE